MPENNDNGMPENTEVDGSITPEEKPKLGILARMMLESQSEEPAETEEEKRREEVKGLLEEIRRQKEEEDIQLYVPPKETEKDVLEGKKPFKPDTRSWDKAKLKMVFSRGGEKGGAAYPVENKGFLEKDAGKRTRIIQESIVPKGDINIDETVAKMFDPFNEKEGIFDVNGFLKTKDENDKRIRGIYKGKGDTEPRVHHKDTTASNVIFFVNTVGEELDLTPIYVDMRAFEELVKEKGEAKAMQITLGDAKALVPYKNKIRNELKEERKDTVDGNTIKKPAHEKIIEKRIKDYVWKRLGLEPNESFSDNDELVLKVNIEGQVNKEMRAFRLREKSAARINHRYKVKRLYTTETTAGRDVGLLRKYETPQLHEFKDRVGGLEGLIEKIALPVSEFLGELHGKWKMKHRDMKPSNIFLDKEGCAVVADFGLAKIVDEERSDLTREKSLGTPSFMTPEQARAEDIDETGDIYSFGRTIESMYKRDSPYVGNADEVYFAIRSGKKPFAMSHKKYGYLKYEGLDVDKWYSRLNPFKLWRMWERHNMVRDFETVTSWACQLDKTKRPKSCDVIYQDYKNVLEGKKPENVENYMTATKGGRKELIEGAYETGKELVSEEARLAVRETHNLYQKYLLPAVAIGGMAVGATVMKGCDVIRKAMGAISQYEQRLVNK